MLVEVGTLPACPGVSQPWPQSTWETPALPCSHLQPGEPPGLVRKLDHPALMRWMGGEGHPAAERLRLLPATWTEVKAELCPLP